MFPESAFCGGLRLTRPVAPPIPNLRDPAVRAKSAAEPVENSFGIDLLRTLTPLRPAMLTRTFTADDVESVARLFRQARPREFGPALGPLRVALERLYLASGSRGSSSPSRILESDGRVLGFLGAVPVPMQFRGRQVDAVIGGELVIRPDLTHPFVSSRLLRDFFDGPHELALTETGDARVRSFWEANGSACLAPFQRRWLHVLRPAHFAAQVEVQVRRRAAPEAALQALTRLAEKSAQRRPRTFLGSTTLATAELTGPRLRRALAELAEESALCPAAHLEAADRILEMTDEAHHSRPIVSAAVLDGTRTVGWYRYAPRMGGTAEVLDMAARADAAEDVLERMFADARQRDCTAITGRVHPRLMPELAGHGCLFLETKSRLMASSRNRDILHALHRGDACLPSLLHAAVARPAPNVRFPAEGGRTARAA